MEKVELNKKENRLAQILSSYKAKYIICTLIYSGLGIAIPRVFHILAGSSSGATFLPMHLMVLISALTFGIISATIVAGSSVIFSYLLTGMPAIERMPYMLIELVIYAIILSIFRKKLNPFISLGIALVLGRIIYAVILFASTNIFGFNGYGISVLQSTKMGIPGIIIQLVFVPLIAIYVKKGLKLDD